MNWASDQEYLIECHLCSAFFTHLLLTGQVGCEAYVAVALFLLSAGLNTFTVPGCKTSMLDMAPAYSGRDITNTSGVIFVPGICWPPHSIPYTDKSYETKLFSLSHFCKYLFSHFCDNCWQKHKKMREIFA
jgi:hypothetical protein